MIGFYLEIDGVPQHVYINAAYHGPCDCGCGGEFSLDDAFDVEDISFFGLEEEAEKYIHQWAGCVVKSITIGKEQTRTISTSQ